MCSERDDESRRESKLHWTGRGTFRKPSFHIQTSRTLATSGWAENWSISIRPGRIWTKEEDVRRETDRWGKRAVTLDWPVIAVCRTVCAVFFIPASVFSTQPTKHSKWGFRRLTGLSLPPHGAQLPSERGDVSRVFFTEMLCLLRFSYRSLCPFLYAFDSVLSIFNTHHILWLNNRMCFKNRYL